jgi:hypothetical protein
VAEPGAHAVRAVLFITFGIVLLFAARFVAPELFEHLGRPPSE